MRIHLYSLHGLFRANELEIGRDADNGGQIIYVMEVARALSQLPEVEQVHLFTRRIEDPALDPVYAEAVEKVNDKFDIRRIWCGGKKYLPKEQLWEHLEEFITNALTHIKTEKIFPDWMHSHYADAGYVTRELSSILNVPFAHTGHSLGMPKLEKLINSGMPEEEAKRRYKFDERFGAEDGTLANAEFIVTSTAQEILTYDTYSHVDQAEFHVIPPGINFERYYPYYEDAFNNDLPEHKKQARYSVRENMEKFFSHPDRPLILTICRPDKKKNIHGLIHAYGTDKALQAMANLAIFAGIRSDISTMPSGEKEVLTEILLLMDKYNLYGKLAIPKRHDTDAEVPEIYRLCAVKKGVFVNIALTEPFGLTILEATACGCPVVATQDGGPSEIIPTCQNGLLVPPTDTQAIQQALHQILTDEEEWKRMSNTGVQKIREHYSWESHVKQYLQLVHDNRHASEGYGRKNIAKNPKLYGRLKVAHKMIITDIDGTLISETGDFTGLDELKELLRNRGEEFVFGVASGRSLDRIKEVLEEHDVPQPDVVISSVGTCIHYGTSGDHIDKGWESHIEYQWNPAMIRGVLETASELELQEPEHQTPFKISYYIPDKNISIDAVKERLGKLGKQVNILMTNQAYLDILPKRASKGRAVRYIGNKWSIPLHDTIVCGDAGNDLDMFTGATRGIVVGNHAPEMESLKNMRRIYFSEQPSAAGIVDGIRFFKLSEPDGG